METSQTLAEEAVVSQHFMLRYVIFTPLIPPSPIFDNQLLAHSSAWSAIIINEKEKDI